jgi:DnaJ-class molecular chaperone
MEKRCHVCQGTGMARQELGGGTCQHCEGRGFYVSNRKPHSDIVGYVCELKNRRTGSGYVVIYDRQKGFDCDAEYRYIISCETHNTMTSAPSLPKAREIMKAVDFCEECMAAQS